MRGAVEKFAERDTCDYTEDLLLAAEVLSMAINAKGVEDCPLPSACTIFEAGIELGLLIAEQRAISAQRIMVQ